MDFNVTIYPKHSTFDHNKFIFGLIDANVCPSYQWVSILEFFLSFRLKIDHAGDLQKH